MIRRLIGSLVKKLILHIGVVASLTLLLLCIIILASLSSLAGMIRGLEVPALLLPLTLALCLGWWSGAPWRSTRLFIALSVLGGSVLLTIHLGRLYAPILTLLDALIQALVDNWPWQTNWAPVTRALTDVALQTNHFLARLVAWLSSLWQHQPRFDPIAVQAVWGWLLWMGAAWSGWWIRRRQAILIGLLPLVALLAGTLNYVGGSPAGLLIPGGASLLLFGLSAYAQNEHHWSTHSIDFSTELRLDVGLSVLLSAVCLVALALTTPSISVQRILVNNWSWIPRPGERGDQVAKSLGIQPNASETGSLVGSSGGLPRSHLIGSNRGLEEQILLVIETGDLPPLPVPTAARQQVPRYYWRLLTYDTYTGLGWETSPTQQANISAGETIANAPDMPALRLRQEIRSLVDMPYLISAGEPSQASVPIVAEFRSLTEKPDTRDFVGASLAANRYLVESYLPAPQSEVVQIAGGDYPAWLGANYLQLPSTLPLRVRRLAYRLIAGAATPFEAAQAIERYLRTYPYSLDLPIPPEGEDVVDYFLFSLERGYCDYFASAMVVLSRAAGIPARLAIGYASGYYDAPRARYLVSAAEAHSWPELYFPQTGWVIFEPTSGEAYLDEKSSLPAFLVTDSGFLPGVDDRLTDQRLFSDTLNWIARYWPLPAGLLLAFGAIILIQLPAWRLRRLKPATALERIYADLRRISNGLAVPLQTGDTPNEFATHLQVQLSRTASSGWFRTTINAAIRELENIVRLYNQEIFSRHSLSVGEQHHAVQTWSRLRWRLCLVRLANLLISSNEATRALPDTTNQCADL